MLELKVLKIKDKTLFLQDIWI